MYTVAYCLTVLNALSPNEVYINHDTSAIKAPFMILKQLKWPPNEKNGMAPWSFLSLFLVF